MPSLCHLSPGPIKWFLNSTLIDLVITGGGQSFLCTITRAAPLASEKGTIIFRSNQKLKHKYDYTSYLRSLSSFLNFPWHIYIHRLYSLREWLKLQNVRSKFHRDWIWLAVQDKDKPFNSLTICVVLSITITDQWSWLGLFIIRLIPINFYSPLIWSVTGIVSSNWTEYRTIWWRDLGHGGAINKEILIEKVFQREGLGNF